MKKIDTENLIVDSTEISETRDEPGYTEINNTDEDLQEIYMNTFTEMLLEGDIDKLVLSNGQFKSVGSILVINSEGEELEIDNPEFTQDDYETIIFNYLVQLLVENKNDKNFDILDNINEYVLKTFLSNINNIPKELDEELTQIINSLEISENNTTFNNQLIGEMISKFSSLKTIDKIENSDDKVEVFALSHIDADGYGSSLVYDYNEQTGGDIFGEEILTTHKYNANYDYIGDMVDIIKQDIRKSSAAKKLFLVTDLSLRGTDLEKPQTKLSEDEANKFSIEVLKRLEAELAELGCDIKVIDHHASGKNEAEVFDWYKLDTSNSATLGTFKILSQDNKKLYELEDLVLSIDNYDIYKEHNSKKFLKGSIYQVLTTELMGMFPEDTNKNPVVQNIKTDYMNYIFTKLNEIFTADEISIVELNDGVIAGLKKDYMKQLLNTEDFDKVDSPNLTLSEKVKMSFYYRFGISFKEDYIEKIEEKMDETYSTPVEDKLKYAFRILENKFMNTSVKDFEKTKKYIESYIRSENAENQQLPEYESIDTFIGTALFSSIQSKNKNNEEIISNFIDTISKDVASIILSESKKLEITTKEEMEILKNEIINDTVNSLPNTEDNLIIKKAFREVELSNNKNIPYNMLASMYYGPEMIDNNTNKVIEVDTLDTKLAIVTDIKSSIYQHAVFEQNTYNTDTVFLKIDYERGSMSIRSKNGKANKIAAIFGGGGHPDAGGGFIPPKKVFGEDFVQKYKKSNRYEKKEMQDFMRTEYIKYIVNKVEEYENNLSQEKEKSNTIK